MLQMQIWKGFCKLIPAWCLRVCFVHFIQRDCKIESGLDVWPERQNCSSTLCLNAILEKRLFKLTVKCEHTVWVVPLCDPTEAGLVPSCTDRSDRPAGDGLALRFGFLCENQSLVPSVVIIMIMISHACAGRRLRPFLLPRP